MSSPQKPPLPPKPFERVMVFIDGGYLRDLCKKVSGHDDIDFEKLSIFIIDTFNNLRGNPFQANLIRIYYYDAIVEQGTPKYDEQDQYFEKIRNKLDYTVKLGELVKSSNKPPKQKGVDILMAIDALTKAYQNQYEHGIFIVGDRDFVPLVNAVKDAGKKTLCLASLSNCSEDLLRMFDKRVFISDEMIKSLLSK